MNIGALNKKITVQRPTSTKDAYGQQSTGWTTVKSVWGNIRPITGRERLRSGAVESTTTHTIAIWFDSDFAPLMQMDGWRLTHSAPEGTRLFNITSAIDLDERRQFIILDCEEGTKNG